MAFDNDNLYDNVISYMMQSGPLLDCYDNLHTKSKGQTKMHVFNPAFYFPCCVFIVKVSNLFTT